MLTLVVAWFAVAYTIAASSTRSYRLSQRWCATAIVGSWMLTALFYALTTISAFRLSVALILSILLAAVVHLTLGRRCGAAALLVSDARASLALLRARPDWIVALCAVAVGTVFVVRVAKGIVAPPLAWDALTYHLVKAGRWVHFGGWARDVAPDAWRYYEYFPPGGDLLWAWAMLPTQSDALIAVAGGLVWLVCLLAGYSAACALGATRRAAATTAMAVAVMPCVLSFVTSAYVTGILLADLLLALTFLFLTIESGRLRDGALAVAALALAAGVQPLALPFLAIGVGLVLVTHCRRHGASGLWRTLAICVLVGVPMLTGYFVAWMETGSPLYPLPLTIGGRTLLAGNEQLAAVFSGSNLQLVPFKWSTFIAELFYRPAIIDHLNFGAGAAVLVLLGVSGVWPLLGDSRRRMALIPLAAFIVIPVAGIMSDEMLAQRTFFAPVTGRLLAPSLAAIALIASIPRSYVAVALRVVAVLIGALYAMPRTMSAIELSAIARIAPHLVAATAAATAVAIIGRRYQRPVGGITASLVIGASVLAYGIGQTRLAVRFPIYAAAGATDAAAYDLIPLTSFLVVPQIWEQLDRKEPLRIAFAAGWDGFNGHTSFRYPLLGRRLQNAVVYVSPTRDGDVIDYKESAKLLPQLDFGAWLRRLVEENIAAVVVSVPGVPELSWMRRHPKAFVPLGDNQPGAWTWAFMVDATEARALAGTALP